LIQFIKVHHLDDKSIVIVSFRKTFTNHLLNELRRAGLNSGSYEELDGPISLTVNKILIIQAESLRRIQHLVKIDLLIMDEMESILGQWNAAHFKYARDCWDRLTDLASTSTRIIGMDAYLGKRSLETPKNFLKMRRDLRELHTMELTSKRWLHIKEDNNRRTGATRPIEWQI